MSGFEFIFGLFSLLLGLAMAEVLGGFAMVVKRHARVRAGIAVPGRVGWLVPLLALFVLLSQLTFWTQTYAVQQRLPFNYVTLLAVTAIVGGYYLLSSLVWPDDPELWPDFDAYYDRHNRPILAGNLVLTIAAGVIVNLYGGPVSAAAKNAPVADAALAGLATGLLANVALIFVRRRRLNAALLVLLIVAEVGGSIALVAAGLGHA